MKWIKCCIFVARLAMSIRMRPKKERKMGKFDSYKIDLRGMQEVNASYDLSVDNEFFAHIDGPEVQKGKVQVKLDVHRTVDVYEMSFVLDGVVVVNCDRCLDEMDLDIHTTGQLQVKLGADYGEQGDVVIIPEAEGVINVAWYIYEFVALAIPMKHVHAPGKCNKEMSGKLNKHLLRSTDDEDFGEAITFGDEADEAEAPVDPRWEGLKKIINN